MSEPGELPQYLDPRKMPLAGAEVLRNGLPVLPDVLTYQMSIPVAFWKADEYAVVLFLSFSRDPDDVMWCPRTAMGTFTLAGDVWNADRHWGGTGWSHDPIADPHGVRDLGGRAMASGGGSVAARPVPGRPAAIVTGRVAPAVAQIAVVQDGSEDRRPLQSHFGAWVVCIERPSPYQITALDEKGNVLASIEGDTRCPVRARTRGLAPRGNLALWSMARRPR
jgi:hypothetical protein